MLVSMPATPNVFHDHLDDCPPCRDNPTALCPKGVRLLEAAARGETEDPDPWADLQRGEEAEETARKACADAGITDPPPGYIVELMCAILARKPLAPILAGLLDLAAPVLMPDDLLPAARSSAVHYKASLNSNGTVSYRCGVCRAVVYTGDCPWCELTPLCECGHIEARHQGVGTSCQDCGPDNCPDFHIPGDLEGDAFFGRHKTLREEGPF